MKRDARPAPGTMTGYGNRGPPARPPGEKREEVDNCLHIFVVWCTHQARSSPLLFLCLSISVPVPTPSRVPDLCSFTRRTLTTQKIVPESRNVRGALRHATCFIISFLFSRQISPVREKHHPHESFRRPHVQQRRVDRVVPGGRLPDFGLGG